MIEIEDPPDVRACMSCMRPIVWLWSPRTKTWVKFAAEPADNRLLRVDECRTGDHLPSWRQWPVPAVDEDAPERARRGRALVEQALADVRTSAPEGKT
jgi:hypothetical protein